MLNNIRYILFDLGFVLVELNGMPWFKQQYPDLTELEIHRRWVSLNSVKNFETGKITEAEFFKQAIKDLNLSVSVDEFAKLFKNWVLGPYPQCKVLLTKLKQNYAVGCLSNTNACHIQHLNQISDFLTLMDNQFFSHELGVMKPDALVYQQVIEKLALAPETILFIDDSLDNVNAAKQLGLQAFQAKGFDEVLACLNIELGFSL